MKNKQFFTRLTKILYVFGLIFLLTGLLLSAVQIPVSANGNTDGSGRIWTTSISCGQEPVNENHYDVGEPIYIHGAGFAANTTYNWVISHVNAPGNPKPVMVSGTVTTKPDGSFCFPAWTPTAAESSASATYQAKVGEVKGDNFKVIGGTPAISIVKTASPTTYDSVGDVINYSYVVTNTGTVILYNLSVVDSKISVSCPSTAGGLAPTASITCTASYTIKQSDLDNGQVYNTAYATDGVTDSTPDDETVFADQNPALTIDKSANPTVYSSDGEAIGYSYVIKNTGNVTLSAPFTVDDDKIGEFTCSGAPATLAPDASFTCSGTYSITQSDVDFGSVTNTATASATSPTGTVTSGPDSATVTASQSPALAIVKTSVDASFSAAGQVLHYQYEVTNIGNVTLTGIFVSDDKITGNITNCASTTLLPGDSTTCSAEYTTLQADMDFGSVTNVATATGSFNSTPYTSAPDDLTIPAMGIGAQLGLQKVVEPTTYDAVGQTLVYTYTLTNIGNVTLDGPFSIDDDKLDAVDCSAAAATLLPGASTTCTASYTITQDDLDAGSITNLATGQGAFKGSPVYSNEAEATATALGAPGLTLDKSVTPATYDSVGDVLDYSYELTNTGAVTLSGPFTVTDDKATVTCPEDTVLGVGQSITCTASYVISQADLDAGFVTNLATGHGSFDGNTVDSNTDTETADAVENPAIGLDKTADEASYDEVGDLLHYDYVITNTGNVTLYAPFSVTDDKTTVSCPATPASLAPGASITCAASYTITQADLDAGSVTNKAIAHNGSIDSNEDQVTVEGVASPALYIDKSAVESTFDAVGDVLHYNYDVENTGNVTLYAPFNIHDDRIGLLDCPADVTSLAPGASVTCEGTYTINIANLNDGAVGNTAYATGFDGDGGLVTSNEDTVIVYGITPGWTLQLTKTVDPATYANVGDKLTYTYTLLNTGNMMLFAPFSVTDDKETVDCSAAGASLASGASTTCTAEHTVTQADLDAGEIVNIATAYAKNYFEATITSNTDDAKATADQNALLTLDKEVDPAVYTQVGDVLDYTYELTNDGNVTLTGPFTVDDDKATVTCPDTESLLPGESITCDASYTISQADLDEGSVTNVATGHAFFGTTPVDSNEDTATANALVETGLSIDKAAVETSFSRIGDVIYYTYTLTNIGQTTLYGPFSVFDDKSTDEACTLNAATDTLLPGATTECEASYTIVEADLIAGFVTNVAYAQGFFKGEPVLSGEDTETVNALIVTPTVTIEGVEQNTCQEEAGRVCLDFTVTVINLTVGAIDFFADAPSVIDDGEVTSFTADGTYIVTVCGNWPGISDPSLLTELTLAAHADWVIRSTQIGAAAIQNPAPMGQEDIAIGTSKITYDPANRLTCFPQSTPTFATPFCNLVNDQWTMAVNLRNPNDTALDITWTIDGGSVKSATIDPFSTIRLGNLKLNERHTIAVYWGEDGFLELRPRMDTSDCVTPPEPPVVVYSIPVTAVEPPSPVTEAVLIPVTGADLGGAQDGFISKLMMYLGVSLLGMAFIAHSLRNKFLK